MLDSGVVHERRRRMSGMRQERFLRELLLLRRLGSFDGAMRAGLLFMHPKRRPLPRLVKGNSGMQP